MAQTKEGAIKVAAAKAGLSADEYKAKVAAGLKRCMKCKQWLPREVFNSDRSRGDGLHVACQGCIRVKVRQCTKGRVSTFKGKRHTPEARRLMSERRKGKPGPWKGKRLSPEVRAKISAATKLNTPRGERHYAFSHGRHQRDKSDRRTTEYKEWRNAVYARDGYTCQRCGDARGGNLQAHHIKAFAEFPELRYEVSNGITYCQDCHEKLHLKPIPTKANLRRRRKHSA